MNRPPPFPYRSKCARNPSLTRRGGTVTKMTKFTYIA